MRRTLVLLTLALLAPIAPAGALTVEAEAPMYYYDEAALHLDPRVAGSGTKADPWVIEGRTFGQPQLGETPIHGYPFAIILDGISGHVVIRGNTFQGAGIGLTTSTRVTIEGNSFLDVGSDELPAIDILQSIVAIRDNAFEGSGGVLARSSGVTITGNEATGTMGEWTLGTILDSVVADNRFDMPLDASVEAASLRIEGNDVRGLVLGMAPRTALRVLGNDIQGDLRVAGPAFVSGNAITDCSSCIRWTLDNPPRLDRTNTVNGLPAVLLANVDGGAHQPLPGEEELGFLGMANTSGVTMRGFHLAPGSPQPTFWDVNDLTLEDMTFDAWTAILGSGTLRLEDVVFPNGARIGRTDSDAANLTVQATGLSVEGDDLDLMDVQGLQLASSQLEGMLYYEGSGLVRVTDTSLMGAMIDSWNTDDDLDVELAEVSSLGEVWVEVDTLASSITILDSTFEEEFWDALSIVRDSCAPVLVRGVTITGEEGSVYVDDFCDDDAAAPMRFEGLVLPADGVFDTLSTFEIDARGSWWGAADGPDAPTHAGSGAEILEFGSGAVLFDPWLTSAP